MKFYTLKGLFFQKDLLYIEEEALMANYKRLQFFDTLSLHFNAQVEDRCDRVSFLNVPDGKGQDQTVELTALGDRVYRMSPFPFRGQDLDLQLKVYQVPAMAMDVNYNNVFAECPSWRESIKLVV